MGHQMAFLPLPPVDVGPKEAIKRKLFLAYYWIYRTFPLPVAGFCCCQMVTFVVTKHELKKPFTESAVRNSASFTDEQHPCP